MDSGMGQKFADGWSSGNPAQFASLFTEDCRYEDIPLGVTARGRTEIETHLRNWLASSSDIRMEVLDQVTDGNRVAVEWSYTGTHDGPFEGLESTGRSFEFRGASVFTVSGTKISACADYWDLAYLLKLLR